MTRLAVAAVALALVISPALAQSPRMIRVSVDFRQSSEQRRDALTGTERRVQRSTGLFTLVDDGGEATLTVATQIPYPQIAFYRDYASGAGYVTTGVTFQEVGTSLRVQAARLSGNQVRVRLTPRISYVAAGGPGVIEFTEAASELVVPSGRPVVVAGGTTQTHAVFRHILGVTAESGRSETLIVLTAQ